MCQVMNGTKQNFTFILRASKDFSSKRPETLQTAEFNTDGSNWACGVTLGLI